MRECRAGRDGWRTCEIRRVRISAFTIVHDCDEAFVARLLSTAFLALYDSPVRATLPAMVKQTIPTWARRINSSVVAVST
jgi:hypothetical protein